METSQDELTLQGQVESLTAERDKYRTLLIEAGRKVPGVFLSDVVSLDFLTHIPEEIHLCVERLERDAKHFDQLQAENAAKYHAEVAERIKLQSEVSYLKIENSRLLRQ